MTVIWAILKITGILFLTVAGFFLAAVLALLFVPVRYQAKGTYQSGLKAVFQISWFLHLITVRAAVDGGFSCTVRAAGFRIYPKAGKKPRRRKRPEGCSEEEADKKNDTAAPSAAEDPSAEDMSAQTQENTAAEISRDVPLTEPDKMPKHRAGTRWKGFCQKVKTDFLRFYQKMVSVKENAAYYKKLLERDVSRRAIRRAVTQAMRIIRHCLPRKVDVCFIAGTGDPASTGQIMAVQGLLYPWFQNNIRIVPDFEEKHLEGEFYIKGHVTACMLAICALRVVINKEVRQFIRLLRKKEEA